MTDALKRHLNKKSVWSHSACQMSTYSQLQKEIARLACLNKDYVLFFRGQTSEYQTSKTLILPSIYRPGQGITIEERWERLENASKLLIEELENSGRNKEEWKLLGRKPLLQWSILQHYEVVPTPLIDVTQSLRVACSFARLNNKQDKGYVYVIALPYVSHRIHMDSEEYLTIIRLLNIAPPEALRPYYQDAFLVGEDVIQRDARWPSEIDLKRRLVAKFSIPASDSAFWDSESEMSESDLYPEDDIYAKICEKVKKRQESTAQ